MQLWLVHLMGTMSLIQRIVTGAVIFAFSQLLFWVNDSTSALWWGFVTVIFSVAEAILLPNLSVLLDRLAPEKHRGAYLGASTLVILGLSLGPFVSGALLEWYGKAVFCVMALGCLSIAALLLINRSVTNARLESHQ